MDRTPWSVKFIFLGLASLGFGGLSYHLAGGGGNKLPQPPDTPVAHAPELPFGPPRGSKSDLDTGAPQSALDFTGLRGVLDGKWACEVAEQTTGSGRGGPLPPPPSKDHRLEFTAKSVKESKFGFDHVGKYEVKGDLIHITDRDGAVNVYGLEFVSDGEIALRPEKVKNGTTFNDLAGQWRRVSLPPGRDAASLGSGPIADAKRQVQKIEAKLAKHEGIQKAALAERDELATKLRTLGVNSSADLKGNIRAQRVAQNLAKLAAEIDGREQQLADIDTALLKARSLVRKLESEEATLSDAEKQDLAVQLKEVEERTDKVPLPVTPLDVDAAVEKALKGSAKPATPKKSK